MLTRLTIHGFKNLSGVDLRLGPFTCVAGPNGSGKSNLFDAISFLAALAEHDLLNAALSVRGCENGDIRNLFQRSGDTWCDEMEFGVEMVIPESGQDDLGQEARASMTFVRYDLRLRYRPASPGRHPEGIQIVEEKLDRLQKGKAYSSLPFPHKKAWRDSAVRGRRTSPYISTSLGRDDATQMVSLHADSDGGLGGGRPYQVPAGSLTRTMLSSARYAATHKTQVVARQEMASWMQLQLEPTALRQPDSFTGPHTLGADGSHLPHTLYWLSQRIGDGGGSACERVARRLSELVEGVREISVDVDERRQLYTLRLTDLGGTSFVASALSDGTLRFLALSVLEMDPTGRGVLCMEEPENGIHPRRTPAMVRLLQDLATDVNLPVGEDNPLRQVIVNTHSPAVVGEMPDDALVYVVSERVGSGDLRSVFAPLPHTWRTRAQPGILPVPRGEVLTFLNPFGSSPSTPRKAQVGVRKVKEREDLACQLPLFVPPEGERA
jgi:predicted ATPase